MRRAFVGLPPVRSMAAATLLALLFGSGATTASASEKIATIAVLPVENLTGGTVVGGDVRAFLINRLVSQGFGVLVTTVLDDFMARHRVRYAAGIDAPTAEALRKETGVDAVLVASFEMASQAASPKVALIARLVSITDAPTVVWADDTGMAGDDAHGLFGLALVNYYPTLLGEALNRIGDGLVTYLKSGKVRTDVKRASKFRPKTSYSGFVIQPGRRYSVAVVPFFNLSERRDAGEILALLFIRHLCDVQQFRVIEPGVARRQLLDARIIMDGGLAISDAETVASLIDADFVLAGRVLRYEDYEGAGANPRVEFSAVLIEKATRRVVWSSNSYNDGDDGVHFFERGASRTAHAMATQMVRLTTEMIVAPGRKKQ